MNKKTREQFEQDMQDFAMRYSLTRVQTESPNFDRDYRRGVDGRFLLVSEKAVVKALGKTTKVRIGEGEQYKTFEEAQAAARAYWSAYFKERRNRWTDAEKRGEARRQKRYREKRKQEERALKEQQ